MTMTEEHFSKTFFVTALFVLVALTAVVLFPLVTPIVLAAIAAYTTYPFYKFLHRKIKNKQIAASIIVLIILILLVVPSYFAVNSLSKEGYSFFITMKQKLASGAIDEQVCAQTGDAFCKIGNKIVEIIKDPQFKYYLEDITSKVSNYVITFASNLITSLPVLVTDIFVMLFMMFYFLIDGTAFIDKMKRSIPLRSHHIDDMMNRFGEFTYATIYGNLITAIIQGTIGGIIFYILGLSTPILAGLAMAFFAFIPFLGTAIVWVPVVISLFLLGETSKAVILLILGTFIISTIDNIIKPEIIGKRTNLHPAATMVGIVGGLFTMGMIGILIGPLVISLLLSFIEVYYKEGY